MPSIHLRACSYAHSPATPVLTDVDLHLDHDPVAHARDDVAGDWVGVVGANGAGKSTLLGLVTGALRPTAGSVDVHSDAPPSLVPQTTAAPTADVLGFAQDWDGGAQRLRRRLGLDPDDLLVPERRGWHALSPGTRTRWLVAAALASDADVLLLDEPTNHLDAHGRTLLLDGLRQHRGLGLVVSHDRSLLEALTTRTLRVAAGGLTLHAGAYGEASARWRMAESSERAAAERARRRVQHEQAALSDLRRARHGAEASARRDRRLAGPRDSDAREVGRKVAAANAERAIARRVAAQHSRLGRAESGAATDVRRDHRGAVAFSAPPDARRAVASGGQVIARIRGDVDHAGGTVVLRDVDLTVGRGDRIHLAGANGAGKTTLLRALLNVLPATAVVAQLGQELAADPRPTWLDELDPDRRGRVLGTAALLGVDPGQILRAGTTSPGERRKLGLARLLVEPADILVLDEPTNHLDLPAVEALQHALADHTGTLLLVTHDDALAAAATHARWTIVDGVVMT